MTRYTPSKNVLLTDLGDGTGILLNLGTRVYYTLNATGMHVWARMESNSATLDELVAHMVDAFEVGVNEARADIEELVAELDSEGLIETVKSEP